MISHLTIIVIAVTFVCILILAVVLYNKMHKYQQIIQEEKQNIVASLKQRHDAIPQLVEIVGAGLAHERLMHKSTAVTRQLQANRQDKLLEDQGALSSAEQELKGILMLSENHPELKTSSNMQKLAKQLVKTEDQIAASRRLYNRAAALCLEQFGKFPNRYFIVAFGFLPQPFVEFDMAHVPEVVFGGNASG